MDIEQHDNKKLYCRMLGHHVPFAYCRQPGSRRPCRKIFDCWFKTFDIEGFMKEHFSTEEIAELLSPPKDKMLSLVELIQKAQESAGKQGDNK